jgi:hypothetical protein
MILYGCDNPVQPTEPEKELVEKELASIEIAMPPTKTYYLMGETIDTSGLRVNAIYNDGSEEQTADYTVFGDTFTAGTVSVIITSKTDDTKTTAFEITISNELMNTGIPVIYIETQDAQSVVSKDDYVNGTILVKQGANELYAKQALRIRGRGNATWYYPKKPYKIKLDDKTDFFGMGNDKDWVL